MPVAIQELAMSILTKPKYISVTPVSSTAEKVEQKVYFVNKQNKRPLLTHLIKEENLKNVLVFTRTKHGADNVVRYLTKNNISSAAIHGDKSQNNRQRVLEGFKNKEINILVATETYVHRIGRTGRAGNSGLAVSFCDTEEIPYLKDIEKLIKMSITRVKEHPYPLQEQEADTPQKPDFRHKKKPSGSTHTARPASGTAKKPVNHWRKPKPKK
jgi:ATP-dependent RNA helicase RhlE